jgi:hypothetical protein
MWNDSSRFTQASGSRPWFSFIETVTGSSLDEALLRLVDSVLVSVDSSDTSECSS